MGIFLDDFDREAFLSIVERARKRFKFKLLAYCLMTNHVHLLIQVSTAPLDRIMKLILSRYSRRFNRRTNSKGHVFEERYGRKIVRSDRYLGIVIRYIHGNPVKAGMVSETWSYRWSSAKQYKENASGFADIEAVRELFGDDEMPLNLFEPSFEVPCETYIDQRKTPVFDEPAGPCPNLPQLALGVVAETDYTLEDLRGRSRKHPLPALRAEFFRRATNAGAQNVEAARFLNRTGARVSAAVSGLAKLRNP